MSRLFVLVLLLTVAVGFYWTIGSGTFADRNIHMHLQRAASGGMLEQIESHLDAIKDQIAAQRQWIQRLRFIARNPDQSNMNNADKVLIELSQALAQASAGPSAGPEGGEPAEQLAPQLRSVRITVAFFRPQEQKVWSVVFWILAVAAGITGLLSFVRASSEF